MQDAEPGTSHRLRYQDTNQQDRIGWREIVSRTWTEYQCFRQFSIQ